METGCSIGRRFPFQTSLLTCIFLHKAFAAMMSWFTWSRLGRAWPQHSPLNLCNDDLQECLSSTFVTGGKCLGSPWLWGVHLDQVSHIPTVTFLWHSSTPSLVQSVQIASYMGSPVLPRRGRCHIACPWLCLVSSSHTMVLSCLSAHHSGSSPGPVELCLPKYEHPTITLIVGLWPKDKPHCFMVSVEVQRQGHQQQVLLNIWGKNLYTQSEHSRQGNILKSFKGLG